MLRHRARAGVARGRRALRPFVLALAAVALGVTACNDPLEFKDPDFVRPEDLQGAEAVPTLIGRAVGEFALAFTGAPIGGGGTEGIALASGLIADEYRVSGTFPTRQEYDRRGPIQEENATLTGVYNRLQRARVAAEEAAEAITAIGGDPSRVLNFAGWTYVFFGENYCQGVPFSKANPDGTFEFGQPEDRNQVFQRALDRFNAALATAGGAQEDIANLGIARVLLNQGNFAGAAAQVASVDDDFYATIDHSINSGRQENGIWTMMAVVERWTVADGDGGTGLPFIDQDPVADGTQVDPRTPARRAGGNDLGFDRQTPQWDLFKFGNNARDKQSVLTSGIEARLIEAEYALNDGRPGDWLTILNDLRDDVALLLRQDQKDALRDLFGISEDSLKNSLPDLSDPGTLAGRVDLHFRERAFWLFGQGTRLGDLRRLIRQYGRDAETVFPTGAYFKGGVYGTAIMFPVPFDERNNPNFNGCLSSLP